MDDKILFYEKQQFRQWWLWLLLLSINGFVLYNILNLEDFGNNSKQIIWIPIVVLVLLIVLFWFTKLETFVYKDRIEIIFSPFIKKKIFKISELEKLEVIKYNPILDYGGWGIRFGAYNVSGNMGLKMYFKTKKSFRDSILIGTQKPEELSKIINSIKNE